jgi:N-acetylmuramoyl-L-alanine amidase
MSSKTGGIRTRTRIGIGIGFASVILLLGSFLFFHQAGAKEHTKKNNASQVKSSVAGTGTKAVEDEKKETENTSAAADSTTAVTNGAGNAPTEEPKKTDSVTPDQSNQLQKEFLVVIDPGHQEKANLGTEPVGPGASELKTKVTGGTTGVVTGKPEYKLTLDAALILGGLLEKRGVKVIYTRTTNQVNLSNIDRAEVANQQHADLLIRLHADGSDDQNVRGLSVLTPAQNDPYTKGIFEDSLKASQFIVDETKKNTAVKVNGISYRGDLSGFNWSKVPSTLVEMGYMTNPAEDRSLSDPVYLTNLLTNIADGIVDYANYKK